MPNNIHSSGSLLYTYQLLPILCSVNSFWPQSNFIFDHFAWLRWLFFDYYYYFVKIVYTHPVLIQNFNKTWRLLESKLSISIALFTRNYWAFCLKCPLSEVKEFLTLFQIETFNQQLRLTARRKRLFHLLSTIW